MERSHPAALIRRLARKTRRWSLVHMQPHLPGLHDLLFLHLRRRAIRLAQLLRSQQLHTLPAIFWADAVGAAQPFEPTVSVVVPCYNHAAYLAQRLESLYGQSYPHLEVILLDDGSQDDSASLLRQAQVSHPEITRLILSDSNSGSPFQQWRKGIQAATGDLIWIAESDDFCELNFLETLVPLCRNEGVMLAFSRTEFLSEDGSRTVWSLEHYVTELSPDSWKRPFIESAHQLTQLVWHHKNILPNASSAIFRRHAILPLLDDKSWHDLRICGDWLFYLQLTRGGLVAYSPATTNYYRQHPGNTSVSLHGSERDLGEHLVVAEALPRLYMLTPQALHSIQQHLLQRWRQHHREAIPAALAHRIEALPQRHGRDDGRLPNVMIVTYALIPGGGEILPIRLANSLHNAGYAVTLLNCRQHPTQPGIRAMLQAGIPLIELQSLESLATLIANLGIEILHSHHAWVDTTLCELLQGIADVKHVISSHGMYDTLGDRRLAQLRPLLGPWVSQATYVADPNLGPLLKLGIPADRLTKIANAIDEAPVQAIARHSLRIPEDAFVVCLVSRAIREKGWQEAIAAVRYARGRSRREIHLLILGEGGESDRLKQQNQDHFIHFLGFRNNPRDYFACADLGLLPSFFEGESQPLTLIECLAAGKPYLASDIGEIASMLATPEGTAGMAIPLQNGRVQPEAFAEAIVQYSHDPDLHLHHCRLARQAATKFSSLSMVTAYCDVYRRALAKQSPQPQSPLAEVHPGAL